MVSVDWMDVSYQCLFPDWKECVTRCKMSTNLGEYSYFLVEDTLQYFRVMSQHTSLSLSKKRKK